MNGYTGARGTIVVKLTHMEGRLPLRGATVELIGRGERYTSDRNGMVRINVATPPKSLSLTPDPPARPYSIYSIRITAAGYVTRTALNIQVFAETSTILNENMIQLEAAGNNTNKESETPPHKLWQLTRIGEDNSAVTTMATPTVPEVRLPENITVHLGTPGSDAVDVTVPFITYIKSVASSEIYPTWPRSSLIANVHAQVSLALNRIYTEWYPSQGYPFDIAASPSFDQYYIHNREVFGTIDEVVDEYFTYYIARMGFVEPLFAQFCDGKTSTCQGLSQWGSVDLANRGDTPIEILRYYYGKDVELRRAPVTQTVPDSYPGEPLSQGMESDAVRFMQNRLNRIGVTYTEIPFILLPDGVFDAETTAAVRAFQRIFGLPQTGIVDSDTWYKITYIYTAVKSLGELDSEGQLPEGGAYPGTPLKNGDVGPNVLRMQWFINGIARSGQIPALREVELDGRYGEETASQVRVLQQYFGQTQTGQIDRAAWESITRLFNEIGEIGTDEEFPNASVPGWPRPYPGAAIRRGDSGENVRYIQSILAVLANNNQAIPAPAVDGVFGAETESSVIAFQRAYNLATDGIVGVLTWEQLNAAYGETTPSVG